MYTLIISILFFLLGLFSLIKGLNLKNKKIEDLTQSARIQIDAQIQASLDKLHALDAKIESETRRAAEAHEHTEALLESEHQRAAAELQGVRALEEERIKYDMINLQQTTEEKYRQLTMQLISDFETTRDGFNIELSKIRQELEEFRAKRAAVNEAILRERAIEEQQDFYRIIIKDTDIKDIEILRSIEPNLSNKEILNKLIYKSFIEKPLLEMEKRVLGGRSIGGIYKITYIKTGEAYIGRSVDIKSRWKEHCLSSLNIGSIAHTTFHNILAAKGLQNFTWEVLEEVEKDKQSEREKYWINFYGTQNQFNIKAGG